MTYNSDIKRETDTTQLSVASTELGSVLSLLEAYVDNPVEFNKWMKYAIELHRGSVEIELELKRKLRDHGH